MKLCSAPVSKQRRKNNIGTFLETDVFVLQPFVVKKEKSNRSLASSVQSL
jgi:hypothetical protein